ncbi:MAG: hypothetical protein EOP07_23655, partial [Proteobacteria bacterium]
DGTWVICAKLVDSLANTSYGKSDFIIRDIIAPSFTSLSSFNAATDGYINDSEKLLVNALWSLSATGYTTEAYTAPANDSAGILACNAFGSYTLNAPPSPSHIGADGTYASCVKLGDSAGNVIYGKSSQVIRNTASPTFTSMARANAAADGFINDSEKNSALPMAVLVASNQTSTYFSAALDDAGGALTCDSTQTYSNIAIPSAVTLTNDGSYAICVELMDAAGNKTYGKSAQIVRDTAAASFTSLSGRGDALDGVINYAEHLGTTTLWSLTQTGATAIAYTLPLDDSAGAVSCNIAQSYSRSTIASATDLGSDLPWALCVELTDAAGNISYGKSSQVVRNISGPSFGSLALANAAIGGYINNSEKLLTSSIWNLSASGQISTNYSTALSDTAGALVCDAGQSYGQTSIPTPADLSSDGAYALCAKLTDTSGNITYGKSAQVVRDVLAPSFTSLARDNEAVDGFINSTEQNSNLALYTLTASSYASADYTPALNDAASALTCDAAKTYSGSSIPLISSLTSDGVFAVCVALTDAAGNTSYGKSAQVTRATS